MWGPSGRPLVAPVWFIVEGDSLVFNTGSQTTKGRALARDPRATLCVVYTDISRTRHAQAEGPEVGGLLGPALAL
jgi:nitroimidazol reductase NimA-like FMN-containing flavoprotein (pyridoxamine 5'-phosphate oxidase superfamily)